MTTQKKKSTPKKNVAKKAAKAPVAQKPKESAPVASEVKLPTPTQTTSVAPVVKKKSFLRRFFGF